MSIVRDVDKVIKQTQQLSYALAAMQCGEDTLIFSGQVHTSIIASFVPFYAFIIMLVVNVVRVVIISLRKEE